MRLPFCRPYARLIGSFVDGELTGAQRLRVAQHLQTCSRCATEAAAVESLSRNIKQAVAVQTERPRGDLEGLAGGVISRITAERRESWHGLVDRFRDNWRWLALVGGGSLLGTLGSAVIVSSLMLLVPAPESLAGLINNLDSSPGSLYIEGTVGAGDASPVLVQVAADSGNNSSVVSDALDMSDEPALVRALAEAVTRDGRLRDLKSMSEHDRLYAEGLLDGIRRLRCVDPSQSSTGPVTVRRVVLFTSVNAKAL